MQPRKYGLCAGRHTIPGVEGFFFDAIDNPMDFAAMEEQATTAISSMVAEGTTALDVYVTGLTAALIAVINAAKVAGLSVTLYHYDRDTDTYKPQLVR